MPRLSKRACQLLSDRPFHQKASPPQLASLPLIRQELLEEVIPLYAA